MRLASENDGKHYALWQCFAECEHEMIADCFHHLNGSRKLAVGQVEHRS
jgi:hypothetical protein